MYSVTRAKRRRRPETKTPIRYIGFQTTLFITLISVFILERVSTFSTLTSDWTCVGQRTAMLGETGFDLGFYDVIIAIAVVAMLAALLDYTLRHRVSALRPSKHRWGLPLVNMVAGLGLVAICAIPWAHFNVGDPLADRIYQGRALIAPDVQYQNPENLRAYSINPNIWHCDVGACDGDEKDTVSTYHHRYLPISFRFVVYSDCMSPEFNLATKRAIGADMTGFDGDRRRTARVFFDQDGRFIDPDIRWLNTPLLWSQLTEAEKQPASISFNRAMTLLANWTDVYYDSPDLPTWVDWAALSETIRSGQVYSVYRTTGLLVGIRLMDGSEMIGTQTQIGDLDRLLDDCGTDCDDIAIRH